MNKISMSRKSNYSVEEAFELFIRKCRVKNLTENSINSYKEKIVVFYESCEPSTQISCVTEGTVDNFVLYLKEKGTCNDITINSYLRSLRAFLYYCMECGYMQRFKVHLIKAEKKLKETYTNEELMRLLEKPDMDSCSFGTYKTWVFENYLLATGNRISSAMGLHISDIDFASGLIILRRTKNRKQQIIPLSQSLSNILQEYLTIRGGAPEDYLFCNDYGQQGNIRAYQKLVTEYNISRNVNKTACHLFRHTFAKNWILAGGDIFRLQKILGHSDLTVTKEYVAMFGADLQMDFEKFNPLDRLSQNRNKTHIVMH